MPEPWRQPDWIVQTRRMLDSYRRLFDRELIPRDGTPAEQSERLFEAPFVVLAHGTQPDPILNYGNRLALELWEMDLATFLATPSRLTAQPVHRDERTRLLDRVTANGYIDDYSGVRIASSGRQFVIERAIVFNIVDEQGRSAGQAATFSQWRPLDAE